MQIELIEFPLISPHLLILFTSVSVKVVYIYLASEAR